MIGVRIKAGHERTTLTRLGSSAALPRFEDKSDVWTSDPETGKITGDVDVELSRPSYSGPIRRIPSQDFIVRG